MAMFKQIRIYSCGHRAEFNVEKKPEAKELQVYIPCPQCRNKIIKQKTIKIP